MDFFVRIRKGLDNGRNIKRSNRKPFRRFNRVCKANVKFRKIEGETKC